MESAPHWSPAHCKSWSHVRLLTRFKIEGEFEVPRQTIFSRMKADRLEVWHTGETSPIILVEVLYDAYYCAIFGGAEFCRLRDLILRLETISTYWGKH